MCSCISPVCVCVHVRVCAHVCVHVSVHVCVRGACVCVYALARMHAYALGSTSHLLMPTQTSIERKREHTVGVNSEVNAQQHRQSMCSHFL